MSEKSPTPRTTELSRHPKPRTDEQPLNVGQQFAELAFQIETELATLQSAHDAMKVELEELKQRTSNSEWISLVHETKELTDKANQLRAQLAVVSKERDEANDRSNRLHISAQFEQQAHSRNVARAWRYRMMARKFRAWNEESKRNASHAVKRRENERDQCKALAEELLQSCQQYDGIEPLRLACEKTKSELERLKGDSNVR